MLRVVFDTNIMISGFLWTGALKQALVAAQQGYLKAFVSEALLDELLDVLMRPKFANRINLLGKTPSLLITDYLQFAELIEVTSIPPTVMADRDDDIVLACAFSANADVIVSGDPHY